MSLFIFYNGISLAQFYCYPRTVGLPTTLYISLLRNVEMSEERRTFISVYL